MILFYDKRVVPRNFLRECGYKLLFVIIACLCISFNPSYGRIITVDKISLCPCRKGIVSSLIISCLTIASPQITHATIQTANLQNDIARSYNAESSRYDKLGDSTLTEFLGINAIRSQAAKYVTGNTLETAVGTGIQLGFYDWSLITKFTGVDISTGMLQEAQKKIGIVQIFDVPTTLQLMDVKDLAFEDNKVRIHNTDTVISFRSQVPCIHFIKFCYPILLLTSLTLLWIHFHFVLYRSRELFSVK